MRLGHAVCFFHLSGSLSVSLSKELKSVIGGGDGRGGEGGHGGAGGKHAAAGGVPGAAPGGGRVRQGGGVGGVSGRGGAGGGAAGEPGGGRGAARLRSCSDGSRYSRRGLGSSSCSSFSPPLSNPKSGETSS